MKKWMLSWLLLAVSSGAFAADIALERVWGRFSVAGMDSSGVFLDIHNHSKRNDVLVSGSTPVATKVELHTHINDQGVMRMREVAGGIALPSGQTVHLQPGGLHVMLIGLKQPLQVGDSFPLTLRFRHAPPQTVIVNIKTGSDNSSHPAPHQH